MNVDFDLLARLEQESKKLEIGPEERKALSDQVMSLTERFLDQVEFTPAYRTKPELSQTVDDEDLSDSGEPLDALLPKLTTQIDVDGINPASGFHMGYVPGGGIYPSALADYWGDVTNRYAGVFYANPGAVKIENRLIEWMTHMVGYPAESFGNLTSGGSLANLTAIIAAREAINVDYAQLKSYTVYLTVQAHHCIRKAFKIAGLGNVQFRFVDLDERFRMKSDVLEKMVDQDMNSGLVPLMIIGSAGTTDTGAIDPLNELGSIANKRKIWFHVDAAYGGFFLLTDAGKQKLSGISLSDSVVMDPHKSLFLPYGSGVVLVKDKQHLLHAFSETANYLQDMNPQNEDISPADVSPELTKPFRGLRMWLPLKYYGLSPFRAALAEKLKLTEYFYHRIASMDGFRTYDIPDLTVVPFWYQPEVGGANEFNQELLKLIHQDGQVFLTSTTMDGQFIIRMCILVFRTHKREVDKALEIIQLKKEELLKTSRLTD